MKKSYLFKMTILSVFLVSFLVIAGCSGGGGDAVFLSPSAEKPLKVFVTSASGTGNLSTWPDAIAASATGIAAGDAVCQARATAAGLSGTYKAWLSDSATDAYCHVQGFTGTILTKCGQGTLPVAAGPWVRTHDGFPFAPTIDKLVNIDQVYYPVRYDENGTSVTNLYYWTGTNAVGTYNSACTDWTSNSTGATYASPDAASFSWTAYGGSGCGASYKLLCLQTGTGAPLPSITAPPSSKKVFVTSTSYDGNLGGIAGGDTKCQAHANSAGLANPGKFKAWLSDSTINAIDRFALTAGPWYRLDGVKVADNKAALAASGTTPLPTAISVDETGAYLTNYLLVWSGTDETGIKMPALNCVDWGSNVVTDIGTIGHANFSNKFWTNWNSSVGTCDGNFALYCFEDN